MPTREILDNFEGTTCVCGRPKESRKSHCRSCFFKLPTEKQKALYKRFYAGYEEAFEDSVKYLTEIGEIQ